MSRVSICIRGWRAETLPAAIESALAQTFTDLEVVVVDDRGTLEKIVASFDDDRLRYHRHPEPLGPGPTARDALRLARGDLIGLLDDDDTLLPECIARIVEVFDREPEVGVVFTNHLLDDGAALRPRRIPLAGGRHDRFLADYLRLRPVAMTGTLFRREVLEQGERATPLAGTAPPGIVMAVRAAAAGWPFYYLDEPLAVKRLHAGQSSAELGFRDRMVAAWELFAFDDPECEALRLGLVADARIARAAGLVRRHRFAEARADLAAARAAASHVGRARRAALGATTACGWAVPAANVAWQAYRRARPYVAEWRR